MHGRWKLGDGSWYLGCLIEFGGMSEKRIGCARVFSLSIPLSVTHKSIGTISLHPGGYATELTITCAIPPGCWICGSSTFPVERIGNGVAWPEGGAIIFPSPGGSLLRSDF